MDYCAPRGIPHTAFLRWAEDDQDKALAWVMEEAQKCHNCGTRPADWLNPVTKRPHDPPPYTVNSVRCYGCKALEEERQQVVGEGAEVGLSLFLTERRDG